MTFFSTPLLSNFVFISATIALYSSQECRAIVALLHSNLRKNHFQAFRNAAEISELKKNNVLFSVIIYYSRAKESREHSAQETVRFSSEILAYMTKLCLF
jgi:hypothetical protein